MATQVLVALGLKRVHEDEDSILPFGKPVVSVVTPVFNGARYLAECIESVARQKFHFYEHVILDNASTDATAEIVRHYAASDRRIRMEGNREKLPILANWNRALEFIAPESEFVWLLPADDAMLPQSLERMVGLAHRNPSVGIVGSFRQRGTNIQCNGLPVEREVFPGRDIVRLFLRQEIYAIAPTGNLIRRDLIEQHKPFYREKYQHGDLAAFFNVLDGIDFGFVHEVLMFSRPHPDSQTETIVNRKGTWYRDGLLMLHEFGPRYFDATEFRELESRFLQRYYRFLVRSVASRREREFFAYHMAGLREAGRVPGTLALVRAALEEFLQAIANPMKAYGYLTRRTTPA